MLSCRCLAWRARRAVCALAVAAAAGPPTSLLPPGGPAPPPLLDNEVLALLREEVAPRLRDRKIGVRREAAAGLLAAWRGTCTALQQGAYCAMLACLLFTWCSSC